MFENFYSSTLECIACVLSKREYHVPQNIEDPSLLYNAFVDSKHKQGKW